MEYQARLFRFLDISKINDYFYRMHISIKGLFLNCSAIEKKCERDHLGFLRSVNDRAIPRAAWS